MVFGSSSTTPQFPATATSCQRCHHSRLMALPDVELSISLSLKVRTCGTIACAWDTHCGVPSSPHMTEMFVKNFRLTIASFPSGWTARPGFLMTCADGCFAGFRCRRHGNTTRRSGTLSCCASSSNSPWWLHTAMGSHSDSSHELHFRISTRGLSLVCFGRTRQASRQGMPSSLSLGDITFSCGLRVLVSRGRTTFAAASLRVAPLHVDAAGTDVRALSVRLDPRGERGVCIFGRCPQNGRTCPARLPRSKDHGPCTGSCLRLPGGMG